MLLSNRRTMTRPKTKRRQGAALLEFAILLPLLLFLLLGATDFARVYHDYLTITDSSRNGALYASLNSAQTKTVYQAGIVSAALADVGGLSPVPTVSTATGNLSQGNNYVDVTVDYTFKTLVNFPGIPNTMPLSRTTRMRVVPSNFRMQ